MTTIRQKIQEALQDDQNLSVKELRGMEEALQQDEANGFTELTAALEEGFQDLPRTYDREVLQRFVELTNRGLSQIIVGKTQFVNEARLALKEDSRVSQLEWDRMMEKAKASALLPPVEAVNFSLEEILIHAALDTQVTAEPDFLKTKIGEVRARMMKETEVPKCLMGSCTSPERERLAEGKRFLNQGHYELALDQFSRGHAIYSDPVFLFMIAECYRLRGNIGGAILAYRTFLRTPGLSNRDEIERLIGQLTDRTVVPVVKDYDQKAARGRDLLKKIAGLVLDVAALIPEARRRKDVIKFVESRGQLLKMQERRRIALEVGEEFEKAIFEIDHDALSHALLKLEILHDQVFSMAETARNERGEEQFYSGETTVEVTCPSEIGDCNSPPEGDVKKW